MQVDRNAKCTSYLDKVFREPHYIWKAGKCDLNAVASTLEEQHAPRLQWLAGGLKSTAPIQIERPVNKSSSPAMVTTPQKLPPKNVPITSPVTSSPQTAPANKAPAKAPQPVTAPPVTAPPVTASPIKPATAPPTAPAVTKPSDPTAIPAPPDVDESEFTVTKYAIAPLVSSVWNGAEPQNYQAQFQIGTQPVTFYLDIDTGSSLLWIQSQLGTSDIAVFDQSMYNPKLSSTAHDYEKTQDVRYGDGTKITAALYGDVVKLEPLIANSQQIGAVATRRLPQSMIRSKSNGLIGLGFPPDKNNLVQSLKAQKKLKYASVSMVGPRNDPKKAAEIDKKAVMEPRGSLVIGSVDPSFYTGSIAWCPQISNVDTAVPDRWIVKLDAVLVNDKPVFENQLALVDTGTAYILASPKTYAAVQTAIPGAQETGRAGLFQYPPDSLQSMSFRLGGRTIKLHPEDFSLGEVQQDQSGKKWACSSICTLPGRAWPFPDNLWVLGGIFLDNVVTIFDFADMKVGFADISESDLAPTTQVTQKPTAA